GRVEAIRRARSVEQNRHQLLDPARVLKAREEAFEELGGRQRRGAQLLQPAVERNRRQEVRLLLGGGAPEVDQRRARAPRERRELLVLAVDSRSGLTQAVEQRGALVGEGTQIG